jgi:hypothetical protein
MGHPWGSAELRAVYPPVVVAAVAGHRNYSRLLRSAKTFFNT